MSTATLDTDALKAQADRSFGARRVVAFAAPAVILLYFIVIFFAFDVLGLSERARMDNAVTLVADSYSHKTHFTRNNRSNAFEVAIEGERKGTYEGDMLPEWATVDRDADTALVTLDAGHEVRFAGNAVEIVIPDYGTITANPDRRGINMVLPGEGTPDWINASNTRATITLPVGRIAITKAKTEVYHYSFGWELFWFTLDSPFYGKGPGELISLAFSSEHVAGEPSNLRAMANDFWYNAMWRHGEVAWAIFETVLMAFVGTFGAAIVALPLAFLAANNFTPFSGIRFVCRRVFDLLRGIDGLIWTIILSRAFGPGPLTGSLAILLTDSGTFGKLFSEALENVDNKQIEGVQSTGSKPLQRYRFGVIPQITPVLLSQLLYYLESNTRSATIIGAITGGGIGLLLTQAIITQKDWEEVSYYIILIILMVMFMDTLSGWLRSKLISGGKVGMTTGILLIVAAAALLFYTLGFVFVPWVAGTVSGILLLVGIGAALLVALGFLVYSILIVSSARDA